MDPNNQQNPQNGVYPPQPQQSAPVAGQEYHPKTIFSGPQAPIAGQAPVPPVNGMVYGAAPAAATVATPDGVNPAVAAPAKSSKLPLIIGAVVGVIAIIVVIIGVVIASSGGGSKENSETNKSQAAILQPATDIELEQINSANTQDMTSLDDEKDYPNDSLEDKTLGL